MVFAAGVIGACATPSGRSPSAERGLAPPAALGDRAFQQVLTVRFGERERRLLAAGRVCGNRLVLVLLTPHGLEVLRLDQRAKRVEVERRQALPQGLRPRAVLADLQLVYWPASALRAAWSDAWALRSAPEQRELLHNGERRVQVDYGGEPWQTPVTVEHELLDYRLRVRTVEHARREARAGPPCTPPGGP
jgi:hypothetical protein